MAYTPVDPTTLNHGLLGNDTAYSTLAGNHNEVYENDDCPVVDFIFAESLPANQTDLRVFTWRVRGNRDLRTIRTRIYAVSTTADSTVTVTVGGVSSSQTVSSVAGWFEYNITPAVGGMTTAMVSITTGATSVLTITRVTCRFVAGSPGTRLASGFTRLDSVGLYAANEPVASEYVSRFLAGPVYVARERPRCVMSHVVRTNLAGGSKSVGNWQAYNTTSWELVGFGRVPECATRTRPYVVDLFTLETTSGASQAQVVIGGFQTSLTDLGGSTGKWHTFGVDLSPGPHDFRVSLYSGTGNYVRVAACQVWRTQEVWT